MDYLWHEVSPLGGITLASDGDALTGLWFDGQKYFGSALSSSPQKRLLPVFEEAGRWLNIYFSGKAPDFTPALRPEATPFRRAVWEILRTIPYGQTATYGETARRLMEQTGQKRVSARAVGGAVGHNPIALIIPCHRVVGADGGLTGYAGGIERKIKLLKLEGIRAEEFRAFVTEKRDL